MALGCFPRKVFWATMMRKNRLVRREGLSWRVGINPESKIARLDMFFISCNLKLTLTASLRCAVRIARGWNLIALSLLSLHSCRLFSHPSWTQLPPCKAFSRVRSWSQARGGWELFGFSDGVWKWNRRNHPKVSFDLNPSYDVQDRAKKQEWDMMAVGYLAESKVSV